MTPIELMPARAWRTYLGGRQIDRLHGKEPAKDSHFPEEWLISAVTARNPGRERITDEGISYVKHDVPANRRGRTGEAPAGAGGVPECAPPDGDENSAVKMANPDGKLSLRQLLAENPEAMLGKQHAARYGDKTGVLVKLIDSSERLTIQVHPDRTAAKELFGSEFGKTECWHILAGRDDREEKPCIYLGFREGITRKRWKELFDRQAIPQMLGCLHRFDVEPGDTFLVPGGVPHAIGAGCLLIEIQEPTDYTIRTERTTPAGLVISDAQCHQGLGFERMFDCFRYEGCSREKARSLWKIPELVLESGENGVRSSLIDSRNTDCFRMETYRIRGDWRLESSGIFSGIYVTEGKGMLLCGDGRTEIGPGSQFFLPAACEPVSVSAKEGQELVLFRFFGPQ